MMIKEVVLHYSDEFLEKKPLQELLDGQCVVHLGDNRWRGGGSTVHKKWL